MTDGTLLPPNASAVERGLDRTVAVRLSNLPPVLRTLWNASSCPAPLLPYLAWSVAVDEWDNDWGTDRKREVIREAPIIQRKNGTPAAIRSALTALGQGDAEIIERADCVTRNGTVMRKGLNRRRGLPGWATYRIVLLRPITVNQALLIQRLLRDTQRNCVHLVGITYNQAAMSRNGQIVRDASYTRGSVNTELN
jgi:phage tail P2-like protein